MFIACVGKSFKITWDKFRINNQDLHRPVPLFFYGENTISGFIFSFKLVDIICNPNSKSNITNQNYFQTTFNLPFLEGKNIVLLN